MNDLDKLKATLTEIGCEFVEKTAQAEYGKETYINKYDGEAEWDTKIVLYNGIGYYSFVCEFYFLKGKFQKHGVWE
jgi:hypothetical protein